MKATSPEFFARAVPETLAAIKRAQTITVLSHYNPDPDAYGSSCGLALSLRTLGKAVEIVNESGVAEKLSFIPGVKEVRSTLTLPTDLVIVCDCGDIGRVGDSLVPFVKSAPVVINLDHHTSNDLFGTIHLVDETASSSSELVTRLLIEMAERGEPVVIPVDAAQALYAGISADTGSFKYSSTSARTFQVAAALVSAGASPHAIGEQLYSNASLAGIRLHARVMAELRLIESGSVCVLSVPESLVLELGASPEDSEGLVEKGRDIEGVKISVLMRWVDGLWRVSLRSRDARWNVSEVAQAFGGGGHKVAAAFRWRKSQAELEALLLPQLESLVRRGRNP